MNRSETQAGMRLECSLRLAAVFLGLLTCNAAAGSEPLPRVWHGAEASHPVTPTLFRGSIHDLPAARAWQPGDPIKEIPRRGSGGSAKSSPGAQAAARDRTPLRDPLLDVQARVARHYEDKRSRVFSTPFLNFPGQEFSGVNPPDTVGDVGPVYYVQAVNAIGGAKVAVYNKLTGVLEAPVFAMDGFAPGGTLCASGNGDPVVLYDQMADRWLLSEFAGAGNRLCVYVSTTNDPTAAGWYAYEFTAPRFPDYPKYAVWPDAYYVSSNENNPAAYAMDRTAMLAGAATSIQRFTAPDLSGFNFQALQAADVDGPAAPPAGSPGIFIRHNDDEAHNPISPDPAKDTLELFFFDVDFATPANSTFSGPFSIDISEIDSDLCGYLSFSCFLQPATPVFLDPLREVVMFRLAYRNFGSHETLVGNLVTDVSGADQGGIRWFELRKTGAHGPGGWTLFQEGTYAPDTDNRWMGSIAMDGSGNIALGYSVTSATTFPSMRYTGRLASDPAGTLPQGEHPIVAGPGSSNSNRWGDYSAMNIDPVDDCTFWHTNMYARTNGQWATQIASFAFDACGEPGFTLAPDNANPQVCAPGPVAPVNLTIGSVQGFSNPVTLSLPSPVPGITGGFTVNPVTPTGFSNLNLSVDGTVTDGEYAVVVEGTAAGTIDRQAVVYVAVTTAVPGPVTLATPADGATIPSASPTLTWNAIPGATGYDVEVAADAGFATIVASAAGLSATSFEASGLNAGQTYYWRVRASNLCGNGGFGAAFSFTTGLMVCANGLLAIPDGTGVPVELDIATANSGIIADLDVSIQATHAWVGDLIFTLEHLDTGTTIDVIDRPGFTGLGFGCAEDDIDAIFDDSSALPVEDECNLGSPALTGVLAPHQPLAAFDGEALAGTWRMSVSDSAGGNTGVFTGWCLLPVLQGTADSDGDGVNDDADNCTSVANPDQYDSNGDQIGSLCDADITGPGAVEDCLVNFLDLQAVKDAFFSTPASPAWNPDADFDNSASINFTDLQFLEDQFFGPPGPSAAGCN